MVPFSFYTLGRRESHTVETLVQKRALDESCPSGWGACASYGDPRLRSPWRSELIKVTGAGGLEEPVKRHVLRSCLVPSSRHSRTLPTGDRPE